MSTDLYYTPAKRDAEPLPRALKYLLGPKLWGHDGTLNGSPQTVNREFIPYLEGLRDARTEGAQELIDLIEKYDSVTLWLEG